MYKTELVEPKCSILYISSLIVHYNNVFYCILMCDSHRRSIAVSTFEKKFLLKSINLAEIAA